MPHNPQFAIIFSSSCFEHSGVQLNVDQSDLINNWTVKFVISYRIVFKQVEVSGSWLHVIASAVIVLAWLTVTLTEISFLEVLNQNTFDALLLKSAFLKLNLELSSVKLLPPSKISALHGMAFCMHAS